MSTYAVTDTTTGVVTLVEAQRPETALKAVIEDRYTVSAALDPDEALDLRDAGAERLAASKVPPKPVAEALIKDEDQVEVAPGSPAVIRDKAASLVEEEIQLPNAPEVEAVEEATADTAAQTDSRPLYQRMQDAAQGEE